jgi:hypothetical protein
MGRLLTALHIIPKEIPNRNRTFRHWLYSLQHIHNVNALNDFDMPWWTYGAIQYVDDWLTTRSKPIRVFEFGSGASTAYLRRRADEVYSVENSAGFAEFITPMLQRVGDVDLLVRLPSETPKPIVGSSKPGYLNKDFSDYVNAIEEIGGLFDLIVIDGRAREASLDRAILHLKDDGIIVFDNTHRQRYAKAIAASGLGELSFIGLTPTLPYPDKTSILFQHM